MHHGTSTPAGNTVRSHLLDILLIVLNRVLPRALRPAFAGAAYMAGWENGAATATGQAAVDRVPLWPASARRSYRNGWAYGHSATNEWLADGALEPVSL
jgi:hypothetical protein